MSIPSTAYVYDPKKLYFGVWPGQGDYGPFDTVDEIIKATIELDITNKYWDYRGVNYFYGANPMPEYTYNLKRISDEDRERIALARKTATDKREKEAKIKSLEAELKKLKKL